MTPSNRLLPWQKKPWEQLRRQIEKAELPHAILLAGSEGIGKHHFAQFIAKALLCQQPTKDHFPCDACRSCQWIHAGTHPDWIDVSPEEEGRAIKIDQIRELANRLTLSAHRSLGYKIVMVRPADAMNMNAANALLKTLEEPAKETFMILITHRPMALSATIRSRCQKIYFPAPDSSTAIAWLKESGIDHPSLAVLLSLANGAPFKVQQWVENDEWSFRKEVFEHWSQWVAGEITLSALSDQWNKQNLLRIVLLLFSWVEDMVKLIKVTNDKSVKIKNQDWQSLLRAMASRAGEKKLFSFYEKLLQVKQGLESPLHLNEPLLLEDLLLTWST